MSKNSAWLSSRQAAAHLGIKLSTLYAYASRGLVESVPDEQARGRRYTRESIERLKARHDARAGHTAVAAAALRWGEPMLETSVVEVRADGPYCHGHSLVALADGTRRFEDVCQLLWTGTLSPAPQLPVLRLTAPTHPPQPAPIAYLAAAVALAALRDEQRHGASDMEEHVRARRLIAWLSRIVGGTRLTHPPAHAHVSELVLRGYGRRPTARAVDAVNRALILCADHELAASTFAARVTASTGADLYACLGAALHALSGPSHGGVARRIVALLDDMRGSPLRSAAVRVVRERLARGESIPGFGHPLYPKGDPRATALLSLAHAVDRGPQQLARLLALVDAMAQAGHPAPNLDTGLLALCSALSLPEGAPAALFALGRCAGWVAHVLEQRRQGYLLRPRARYVPAVSSSGAASDA